MIFRGQPGRFCGWMHLTCIFAQVRIIGTLVPFRVTGNSPEFPNINYGDSKYSRYIPNLFFDFFEPKEFAVISRKFLEETTHPNFQFATLLFRLSL